MMYLIYFKIFNAINDNKVPSIWHKISYPSLKPLASWILNFNERLKFFFNWIENGYPNKFWISGFFFT